MYLFAESDFMINHSRFSVELPQGLNQTCDEWADPIQLWSLLIKQFDFCLGFSAAGGLTTLACSSTMQPFSRRMSSVVTGPIRSEHRSMPNERSPVLDVQSMRRIYILSET